MLEFVQFWYSRLILLERKLLGERLLKDDFGIFEIRRKFLYQKEGVKFVLQTGEKTYRSIPRYLKAPVTQLQVFGIPGVFLLIWYSLLLFQCPIVIACILLAMLLFFIVGWWRSIVISFKRLFAWFTSAVHSRSFFH